MDKIILPLVSLRVLTYNHESFIEEALKGAFSQTYEPLEIIISDDKSQDRTVEIIEKLVNEYKGKHKVIFNINDNNLGISAHLSKVMGMSSGEFLVGAAGDDISLPNRVSVIVEEWLKSNKKIKSFFSNAVRIDEKGKGRDLYFENPPIYASNIEDYLNDNRSLRIRLGQPLVWQLGATQAFEKSLYDNFSAPDPKALQEDGIYAFRGLLSGGVKYIDKPLIKYREHINSISSLKSYKSIQRMKIHEKYYRLTQLNDARLIKNKSKKLLRKLFISYQFSRIFSELYKLHFFANGIFILKNKIKRMNCVL
tara:strand:- start:2540 stop:3466 length:927 start_codon:yes stop_codon:yes gene_type:complete